MPPLPSDQRRQLEKAIVEARRIAEAGAAEALQALAVHHHEPHGSMSTEQRTLRNRLRAHGRQLGDVLDKQRGAQTVHRLTREVAYEHWHRMLFARFLAENDLLIHPKMKVPVSLDDVQELAREEKADPWELAASYAEHMLPEIFRSDDPVLEVTLPPEVRQRLQKLLADLPATVFTADDSLGWTYQFWQSAEKDAVNDRVKSGEKITGETLPAVTQLFTEHYMVQFLLHNTIGAWWAGKTLTSRDREGADAEQTLRDAVRLAPAGGDGGYDFDYLRFVREAKDGEDLNAGTGPWRPAAGTYDGWPRTAAQLRVLDPCCGSGHFLVAAFELVARLRMAEEDLSAKDAARAVLADNIFGLELDTRCTQIAAFNLALAAWKLAGKPIDLPPLKIACSGVGPQSTKDEWLKMAEQAIAEQPAAAREPLRRGLIHMHELFSDAPELGSLIDPNELPQEGFAADFETIKPLLDRILAAESGDEEAHERAVAARGMAAAAEILAGDYTLVVTNVPYLGRGSQSDLLKTFAESNYKGAKADLATIFVARMLRWVGDGRNETIAGAVAAVTPQNWLFLSSHKKFRSELLQAATWNMVTRLGAKAFQTPMWDYNIMLLVLQNLKPSNSTVIAGVDVSDASGAAEKENWLRADASPSVPQDLSVRLSTQHDHLGNHEARITIENIAAQNYLSQYAASNNGLVTGDYPRFGRQFWEINELGSTWAFQHSSFSATEHFAGLQQIVRWEDDDGQLRHFITARLGEQQCAAWIRGKEAWGRPGIVVTATGHLPTSLFCGGLFDNNVSVIVPEEQEHLSAVWCFMSSGEFHDAVRTFNQQLKITDQSFVEVPFDLDRWQNVAAEKYPDGLPEPQSDDPTQWLFHGRPERADIHAALQVGVARLAGFRWPAELDPDMRLAPEARALVRRCDELLPFADEDGIVCLPAIRGEPAAADRLRKLLAAAFGPAWNLAMEKALLAAAAEANKDKKPAADLNEWLRESFFEQHCKLFHHRPFVWHVWDGLKDGFSALVNYHRLAGPGDEGRKTLESLTFSYLGDWISVQTAEMKAGTPGADAKLAAAQDLQAQLKLILAGEPPYDIFVRWKPLAEQPAGWNPDINDGVRLNIRPFLSADLRKGKKGAGVLRWCPKSIKWTKDRGQEPQSLRPKDQFPWFWGWDEGKPAHATDFGSGLKDAAPAGKFDGNRWNDLHYTKAAKEAARQRTGVAR